MARTDYLDCIQYEGRIVTDTAVGEAAYCCFRGVDRGLVSMIPSSWRFSPVTVDWHGNQSTRSVDVLNFWDADDLRTVLAEASDPLGCWEDLENDCPNPIP